LPLAVSDGVIRHYVPTRTLLQNVENFFYYLL
jgi:hypothetical protein